MSWVDMWEASQPLQGKSESPEALQGFQTRIRVSPSSCRMQGFLASAVVELQARILLLSADQGTLIPTLR